MNTSSEIGHTVRTVRTVITCHANADFDALGAMIAARRLYPDSALIFPGTQAPSVRGYFLQSVMYLFNFQKLQDLDQERVELVVVVDTRQRSRVSHIAPLLDLPHVEIHTYDHHPDSEDDLPASKEICLPWGSTTTILSLMLQEKGMSLSEEEATILALGIYEDTGNFTFSSTTPHDFQAAAWLLEQGLDIDAVRDMLSRELSSEQIEILSTLLSSLVIHSINGVDIAVSQVELEHYVADFAVLVHKLMDMEEARILFVLGRMGDFIQLVARSRSPQIDVGQICTSFGGGGHPYAASAAIKDRTLSQVKDELFALLYSLINPRMLVKNFMSAPALRIDAQVSLQKAADIMNRYGLKALPVLQNGQVCAIVEHGVAEKAVAHGLGLEAVSEYMRGNIQMVTEENDLYAVMEIILGQRQRLVPVLRGQELVGVITRTDLIHILVQEPGRIPEASSGSGRQRNIRKILQERLPKSLFALLCLAGEVAVELHMTVYAVGGFVRDVLLAVPNDDLDLVVEGDGLLFARILGERLSARLRSHPKFRTAVLVLPSGQKIDVATARLEYYEYPAALPVVELSSLKMDLYRRDFSINTLAVHLCPDTLGVLVDFFGGRQDLKDGVLRVLHSLSFVDDPTRIIRAIRFEQRFQFRIGQQTERLIKNAVRLRLFQKLSGFRIRHELRLLTEDRAPVQGLLRMQDFGLLQEIHPQLVLHPGGEDFLHETARVLDWYRLLFRAKKPDIWWTFFLALTLHLNHEEFVHVLERLDFPEKKQSILWTVRKELRHAHLLLRQWKAKNGVPSTIYEILAPLRLESQLLCMVRQQDTQIKKALSLFFTQQLDVQIEIDGNDLKRLGLKPGPAYTRILNRVRRAVLDEKMESREQQLDLAQKLLLQILRKA